MSHRVWVASVVTALLASHLAAAETPVKGGKLLIKTEPASAKRRMVFSTRRDSGIIAGSDPTVTGATLFVAGLTCDQGDTCAASGASGSILLPAAKWVGMGQPAGSKGFRYKDSDTSAGGVQKVVFKPGTITIKAKGPNWPWLPIGVGDGVVLTFESGGEHYCAEFGGTEKANTAGHVSYRNAEAPPACRAVCGDDRVDSPEECDGGDSAACFGLCQSDCTCPAPHCGNGILEAGEHCDGSQYSQDCGQGAQPGQVGCDSSCGCCIETGYPGCDVLPCCDPEPYCAVSPGFDYCTLHGGLGDPCLLGAPSCSESLLCEPDPVFGSIGYGVCCGFGECSADDECCFGGTCDTGQCCVENGGECRISQTGALGCCAGQLCCEGVSCPQQASIPPGEVFVGACCADVGSACTAGSQCCSGTCDPGSNQCL